MNLLTNLYNPISSLYKIVVALAQQPWAVWAQTPIY